MPSEERSSDDELIRRTAAGDRGAFERLVSRHEAAVFRFARSIARNDAAAEDAMQETFLALWRNAASFRFDASVRSWLLTIARNGVHRQHRRRAGEPENMESLETLGSLAGWGSDTDPEALAIRGEHRAFVQAAIDSLGVGEREVIVLRDLEGLSGEEAAAVIGVPLATMKTRLHRARLKLQAALRETITDA